ncbi:hypothetical protein D1007_40108 [Hordeum vulgare]|nr:hypothetical protein D1007_40108 [Hordeum vulgare]
MIDASNAYRQPPTSKENEDGDGDVDGVFDEVEEGFHGIDIGDLDVYKAQKEMDREPRDEEEDENAYLEKGVKFPTLPATKIWLSDYAIRNYKPFYVMHSDINLRFTMKCEKGDEGCPWKTADSIGEKIDYPAKVDEWLRLQAIKSLQQQIITFDRYEMKYQINEPGGTTRDGHSYGGAAFEVHLQTWWCQCERPIKYHWPCSHLIREEKAANISSCDGKTVRMQEFHVEATRLTWAPRFHPFLDQSQWTEYHGTHIKQDSSLKVETKGIRRTKRFRGDMDDLVGYTSMIQFGSGHFMEASNNINCRVCDEGRHNKRTCKKRRTSKGVVEVVQEAQVLEVVVVVVVQEAQVLEVVVVVVVIQEAQVLEVVVVVVVQEAQVLQVVVVVVVEEAQVLEVVVVVVATPFQ